MGEHSRSSPGWQQPPRRYGKIIYDEAELRRQNRAASRTLTDVELEAIDAAGERLELVCYIGCGFGAILALTAAAIAWADVVVSAIGAHL